MFKKMMKLVVVSLIVCFIPVVAFAQEKSEEKATIDDLSYVFNKLINFDGNSAVEFTALYLTPKGGNNIETRHGGTYKGLSILVIFNKSSRTNMPRGVLIKAPGLSFFEPIANIAAKKYGKGNFSNHSDFSKYEWVISQADLLGIIGDRRNNETLVVLNPNVVWRKW